MFAGSKNSINTKIINKNIYSAAFENRAKVFDKFCLCSNDHVKNCTYIFV